MESAALDSNTSILPFTCGDVLHSGGNSGIEVIAFKDTNSLNYWLDTTPKYNKVTMSLSHGLSPTASTFVTLLPESGSVRVIGNYTTVSGSIVYTVTQTGTPASVATLSLKSNVVGFITYSINLKSLDKGFHYGFKATCINSIGTRYPATPYSG
jgi:hypothetical protein